ncbi:MAG: MgtC/SapB family protein [Calditrichia bacterium]|nr:MgtC/SapB family protein [Calditrichia bacterium]
MDFLFSSFLLNVVKLLLTSLCVFIIGWSRPEKEKIHYLLSLIFIGIGACLFMIVTLSFSPLLVSQPQQIAGNIMLGMIFLGIIIIIRDKISSSSILSVASIWLSGATGLAIGIGLVLEGIIITFITFLIFKWFGRFVHE